MVQLNDLVFETNLIADFVFDKTNFRSFSRIIENEKEGDCASGRRKSKLRVPLRVCLHSSLPTAPGRAVPPL